VAEQKTYEFLQQKVAAFSARERWLLFATGLILVVGLLDYFLIQPVRDERAGLAIQINNLNVQRTNFDQQLEELTDAIANDPAMMAERELEGLENAIMGSERRLRAFTDTLVAPDEMADMLRDILESQKNLTLVELQNLLVTPILTDEENKLSTEIGLYRHPVKLIFEGNYSDTLGYLGRLEGMDSRFYWSRFDYQVKDYPTAQVSLNIYTLSTQEWWIGEVDDE
jgi:MSHA biogenesis protein MshJ